MSYPPPSSPGSPTAAPGDTPPPVVGPSYPAADNAAESSSYGVNTTSTFTPDPNRYGPPPQPSLPSSAGPRNPWPLAVLAMVVIVAATVVAVFMITDTPDATPASENDKPTVTDSDDSQSDPGETSDMVVDELTGMSYPALETPWSLASPQQSIGFLSAMGQTVMTEDNWAGVIMVGQLDPGVLEYTGDLEPALEKLSELTDGANYTSPDGSALKGLKREKQATVEAIRIGDFDGVSMTYRLVWSDTRLQDKGETIHLGLVDVGGGVLAGYLTSLPDLGKEYDSQIEHALSEIAIL